MAESHMTSLATSLAAELRRVSSVVVWVVAAVVYIWVVGWMFELVQFAAARLPAMQTTDQLGFGEIFIHGLLSVLLMGAVVVVAGAIAYFSSRRKWDVHGPDWHAIVVRHGVRRAAASTTKEERGRRQREHSSRTAERAGRWERRLRGPLARGAGFVRNRAERRAEDLPTGSPAKTAQAPLGDWAVRLVAGFNIMVLSALAAVGIARVVGALFPVRPWAALASWVGVLVGVGVFFLARWLFTVASPLSLPAWLHGLVWIVVAVAALFASAPLGVLVISGVVVSTYGRRLARLPQPRSPAQFARSPLVWVLLGIITLLGVAYSAMPPVPLPQAVVSTTTGRLTGGYVSRESSGVYLATCTGLADATSTGERLQLVPAKDVKRVQIEGGSYYLDSGERPSIAKLGLHALGLSADPPTVFNAALRATSPTCAGTSLAKLTVGSHDPSLGAGVIAGPASGTARAHDGEAPIQNDGHTPSKIATLARKYQPTLLVTAADRNWPVSVSAVLAEQGPDHQPVCLIRAHAARICRPTPGDLTPNGATSSDYLQLPVTLGSNRSPAAQFQAFLRGQYESSGPRDQWLADPGRLDPWYSAQIYFYYAGPIQSSQWPRQALDLNVRSGLIGLEYWFYYPFNYYPVVVDSGLMNLAPIAGDLENVDLHQGDWEHVDVLLNPANDTPEWLYLARHAYEGTFVPWSSRVLRFDGTHPVVQAAFGGHPSYLPGCGPGPRAVTLNALSDWLSCGSGRFAFRAATTPLVNIQDTPWACWPGYFGEATGLEVSNSKHPEPVLSTVTHTLYVVGPRGPLVQAENTGVCHAGVPRSEYRPLGGKSSP